MPSPRSGSGHFSWYERLCVAFAYGEFSADEAVLWAEAPDVDDKVEEG